MYTIKAVNVCADEVERSYTFGFSYPIRKGNEEKEFGIERIE